MSQDSYLVPPALAPGSAVPDTCGRDTGTTPGKRLHGSSAPQSISSRAQTDARRVCNGPGNTARPITHRGQHTWKELGQTRSCARSLCWSRQRHHGSLAAGEVTLTAREGAARGRMMQRTAKHRSQGGDTHPHAPMQPPNPPPKGPADPSAGSSPCACMYTRPGSARAGRSLTPQQNHHYSCSYRSPGTSGTHPRPCTGIKV